MKRTYIIVRTSFRGIHSWREAPLAVEFLKAIHRHTFYVEAKIPVTHNDRQLEFFLVQEDLDNYLKKRFPKPLIGQVSCEMIASDIVDYLSDKYGIKKGITVTVSEDNENAGVVEI
mgnify:CR=1 FL=1